MILKSLLQSQFIFTLTQIFISCNKHAPAIEWQKSYGGTLDEDARYVIQTNDGGYAITGYTSSMDGDVIGNHGFSDFWVVKTDSVGNIQWSKTYGGSYFEETQTIIQTPDQGFLVGGFTYSFDGDVIKNNGACDWWILKIDSIGSLQWQQSIGGALSDIGGQIQLADDGGYFISGGIGFNRDSLKGPVDNQDILVVKLSEHGLVEWQDTIGGSGSDNGGYISKTKNGGLLIAISSNSTDGDFKKNKIDLGNIWIYKISKDGKIQGRKNFGKSNYTAANAIATTSDGGYVILCKTNSMRKGELFNSQLNDLLIIKADSIGNVIWQKTYGGILNEWPTSIRYTSNGGYIITAMTSSIGDDVGFNHGLIDVWIIKLNEFGKIEWQKTFGGSGNDNPGIIQQTKDGGYVFVGNSDSHDGDVAVNHGISDFWIVKLRPE